MVRRDDGAIVIRRGRADLVFIMAVFFVLGMMGLASDGAPRLVLHALGAGGLVLTGLAFRHKLVLAGDRMIVRTWRRFEVSRRDITSYHVERSTDDGRAIWIDVRVGARRCRLGQDLVNLKEQETVLLSFLEDAGTTFD